MILVNLTEYDWYGCDAPSSTLRCVWGSMNHKSLNWASIRDSLNVVVYSTNASQIIKDYVTDLYISLTPYSKSDAIQTDLNLFKLVGLVKIPEPSHNTAFLLDEGFQIVHADSKEEWFLLQCKYPDIVRIY